MKEIYKNREQIEKVDVAIAKAFTRDGLGGNEAGIILDANHLNPEEMLYIAAQVGLSETAFVMNSNVATRRVDFYTPERRVPLCGHATIATWGALFRQDIIKAGEYTQELQEGVLKVTVLPDGKVVMDQPLPTFGKTFSAEELSQLLKIPQEWIAQTNLSPQVVNTGLNDLLIPIINRKHLFEIIFNDEVIASFQKANNLDSFHFFTQDTLDDKAASNSRNTDPRDSIHEESATGSAHGALACFMFSNKKVTSEQVQRGLFFEQGDSMKQPSRIDVILDTDLNHKIVRVRVGGYTILP